MPWTTRPSGQALSDERQRGVSGNALDDLAIRFSPQWRKTASSQSQSLKPLAFKVASHW